MLCEVLDEFIDEKPLWFADLSDGRRIWMDDNREGCEPNSAWLRLGEHIKKNEIKIVEIGLRFRSHIEMPLPPNAQGYYFCKQLLASISGESIHSFLIGQVEDDVITVQEWTIPELIHQRTYQINIKDAMEGCVIKWDT